MSVRHVFHSRQSAILTACILLVMVAATVLITAVTAQTTVSTKPTIDPSVASLPPAKQTYVAPRETRMAEFASAHPEIVKGAPAILPPTPTPVLGVQINVWQNPWNPKQPADYLWRGYINGELMTVWAGSKINLLPGGGVEETQQGYVGVAIGTDLTGPSRNYHEYLTPRQAGSLKITAVSGTQVSLVAEDGTTYTFNLDTRTFS